MKTQQIPRLTRQSWLKKPILSGHYRKWLIDNGSLTARLQARYSQFSVKPTVVKFAKPMLGEGDLMHTSTRQTALIREVLLMGNQQPVVFAHSVLPRSSLRGAWHGLGKLGNKPLGAILFANPKIKRTPLHYKKLSACNPISVRVAEHLQTSPNALWARRSIFSLNCAKILVTEVFLIEILNEIND